MRPDERTTVVPDGDREDTVGVATVGPAGVVPELGQRIGRYRLIELLGGGGMGTVFAAEDPQLGRRVALKVLRTPGSAPGARAELLREAQALAVLSHPNVVPIYDVGIEGELVWLAMPVLRGMTLQQWLAHTPRRWPELIDVFIAAAAGLAAAHRDGLVHGDFKPGNVIIGDATGEARAVHVVDFGLARRIGGTPSLELARADALPRHDEATSDGVVRGTPGYMAPELLRGQPVDARTDQFAFCVALFQALHHHAPFFDEGRAIDRNEVQRMLERIELGQIRGPRAPGVPAAIDRVLARGLRALPERRWPTMDVLCARLARARPARARWAVPLAVSSVGVVLSLAWLAPVERSRCEAEPLGELWDESRAAGIATALGRVDAAWADDTAARVDTGLRAHVERWQDAYAQLCVAAPDDPELDRRMRCLGDGKVALATTLDVLERADDSIAMRAIAAVQSLPDPRECTSLLPRARPFEHAALQDRFAEIDALDAAGRYEAARDAALAANASAGAIDDERVQAQALARLGSAHDRLGELTEAEPVLDRAVWLALAAGDEDTAVAAMIDLIKVVGHDQLRLEDARGWERHAEATLARIDARPRQRAALRNAEGLLRLAAGEPEAAIERFADSVAITEADGAEPLRMAAALNNYANALAAAGRYGEARSALAHAIELLERVLGPDHPMIAGNLSNIGFIAERQGQLDDARGFLERAVAISEAGLGEDHPGLYEALNNLAVFHFAAGELDRAEQLFTRTLTLAERHLGPEHPSLGRVIGNLALCATERGDPEAALVLYDRALALQLRALGEDHVDIALTLNNRASALRRLGRFDEARAGYQRALAIRETRLGGEHPDLATTVDNLGLLAVAEGDPRAALALHERALAIWTKVHGENHEKIGRVLTELGIAHGLLGEHDLARGLLERGHAVYDALPVTDPNAVAENQLALADELPDDRERARALARAALDRFEQAGPGYTKERDEARALLRRIGG